MVDNNWQRVGEHVRARMSALGIFQADLQRMSGLSQPTVAAFISGDPRGTPRPQSVIRLEHGLGWCAGSVDAILAGGDPTVDTDRNASETMSHPPRTVDAEELLERIRAELAESERRVAEMVARLMKGGDASDEPEDTTERQRGDVEGSRGRTVT